MEFIDLTNCACNVLRTANAEDKAKLTRSYIAQINDHPDKVIIGKAKPDIRPARPDKPELLDPNKMPRRRNAGSLKSKVTLLHAIAHIELNAIDLAWNMVARFAPLYEGHAEKDTPLTLPMDFFLDWLSVAGDEAKHFLLLNDYLKTFDMRYGDFPAHDGLWEAAEKTRHDLAARLAIVPMVLEARGLDVTPHMIANFTAQGDKDTVAILNVILEEEVNHVRIGRVWFEYFCTAHGHDIESYWQALVREYFHGKLKRPFNHDDRFKAGMIRDWYEPLAD